MQQPIFAKTSGLFFFWGGGAEEQEHFGGLSTGGLALPANYVIMAPGSIGPAWGACFSFQGGFRVPPLNYFGALQMNMDQPTKNTPFQNTPLFLGNALLVTEESKKTFRAARLGQGNFAFKNLFGLRSYSRGALNSPRARERLGERSAQPVALNMPWRSNFPMATFWALET